jgi:hypothetical protein
MSSFVMLKYFFLITTTEERQIVTGAIINFFFVILSYSLNEVIIHEKTTSVRTKKKLRLKWSAYKDRNTDSTSKNNTLVF